MKLQLIIKPAEIYTFTILCYKEDINEIIQKRKQIYLKIYFHMIEPLKDYIKIFFIHVQLSNSWVLNELLNFEVEMFIVKIIKKIVLGELTFVHTKTWWRIIYNSLENVFILQLPRLFVKVLLWKTWKHVSWIYFYLIVTNLFATKNLKYTFPNFMDN